MWENLHILMNTMHYLLTKEGLTFLLQPASGDALEYLVKDYLKHRKEQVFSLSSATVTIQNLLIFQGVIYFLHEAFLTLKDSFLY